MKFNYWQDLEENVIYHIYNRANGKENLFSQDENYRYFLEKWKKYLPYLEVFSFCLMPNHFHFLAKVKPLDDALRSHLREQETVKSTMFLKEEIPYTIYLEDQFKRFFSCYALAYNKQQNRHGSLFQKRFKRISVDDEYRQLYLLAYIHHNPVHHKFCRYYNEWKYSSWSSYINFDKDSDINRDEVLSWFHHDKEKAKSGFQKYHEDFRLDSKLSYATLEDE